MRIFIFRKSENTIRQISQVIDRPPQFIVNMILDNFFFDGNGKEKVIKILEDNNKKYKTGIEEIWDGGQKTEKK